MTTTLPRDASRFATSAPAAPRGRIGPNSVTQLAAALRALEREETARAVFVAARAEDMLRHPPEDMVDERIPQRLFAKVSAHLPPERAAAVLAEAGVRTAEYVLAHRIPRLAQWALKRLPARPAAAMLLRAIERSAWTFAGSGACRITPGGLLGGASLGQIDIAENPLRSPGQIWHVSVFERLFQALVSERSAIAYIDDAHEGDRFVATLF